MGMEISNVTSMIDLINLYGEKDKDFDRELEVGEISEKVIKENDKTGDKALSPWEVMEAVNRTYPTIFSPKEIDDARNSGHFFYRCYGISLKKDTTILGVKFKGDPDEDVDVIFHTDDRIDGILAEDSIIQGIEFKKGLIVLNDKNGKVLGGTLVRGTIINGIKCKEEEWIAFKENEQLALCTLAEDTVIKDVKFMGEKKIYFYDEGQGYSGTLANTTINGIKFEDGTKANFYSKGQLQEVELVKDTIINGVKWKGTVGFYKNGRVSGGILSEDTIINGIKYKGGTRIKFFNNGQVMSGTLAEDTVIQVQGKDIKFKGGEEIGFHENSIVKFGYLITDILLQGIKFKGGFLTKVYDQDFYAPIGFYQSGRVKCGLVCDATTVQGKEVFENEFIKLNEGGDVINVLVMAYPHEMVECVREY